MKSNHLGLGKNVPNIGGFLILGGPDSRIYCISYKAAVPAGLCSHFPLRLTIYHCLFKKI